jgi:hypothetical protein
VHGITAGSAIISAVNNLSITEGTPYWIGYVWPSFIRLRVSLGFFDVSHHHHVTVKLREIAVGCGQHQISLCADR